MIRSKRWRVEIFIDEHDEHTYAEARLHTGDKTDLRGQGMARLNPADRNVPEIGDEVSVARALGDLARRLSQAAAEDNESAAHNVVLDRWSR